MLQAAQTLARIHGHCQEKNSAQKNSEAVVLRSFDMDIKVLAFQSVWMFLSR